jgi:hypothetical protein
MKWNDILFDQGVDPAIKGLEFDLQIEENGGDSSVTHTDPYDEENENAS